VSLPKRNLDAKALQAALQEYADAEDAIFLQRFFKTAEGQYGAGDVFIGVRVPQLRDIAKRFQYLPFNDIQKLLGSKVHEYRLVGLIILTLQYAQASEQQKQLVYEFYLANVYKGRINNWDLVDVTSPLILGEYLLNRPRDLLFKLAQSDNLWQRRVAIVSSFAFIKRGDSSTTVALAEILLHDEHDLIQKAVGWMLREVGKRCDRQSLINFLDQHAHEMPRTMLRYSLEHLPSEQRAKYMQQKSRG